MIMRLNAKSTFWPSIPDSGMAVQFHLAYTMTVAWLFWGGSGVGKALKWEVNRSRSPHYFGSPPEKAGPAFSSLLLSWLLWRGLESAQWRLHNSHLPFAFCLDLGTWFPLFSPGDLLSHHIFSSFLLLLPHPHFASCTNSLCFWVSFLLKNRLCFSFHLIQPVLSLLFHLSQSLGHVWNYVFPCSCLFLKKNVPFWAYLYDSQDHQFISMIQFPGDNWNLPRTSGHPLGYYYCRRSSSSGIPNDQVSWRLTV